MHSRADQRYMCCSELLNEDGEAREDCLPEVACYVETLMVAIQHVDRTALHARLPVQLSQQKN